MKEKVVCELRTCYVLKLLFRLGLLLMVPVTSMMLWFVLLMMKMVKSVKAQNNDNLVETGDCQLSQVDVVFS